MTEAAERRLPKINDKRQKSHSMQIALEYELLVTIMNFEKEKDYCLKPCEVNKALLSIIGNNVDTALKATFGNATES